MIHTLNLTEHATKTTIKFSVETVSPSRLLLKTGKTNSLIFHRLGRNFSFIYKSTKDNKLRQFLFRLLHRIIMTKREFFKFRLVEDEECTLCFRPDSIEHAFLDCTVTTAFYSKAISWFKLFHVSTSCLGSGFSADFTSGTRLRVLEMTWLEDTRRS